MKLASMKSVDFAHAAFATADRYERGRTGYPADAVAWLVNALGIEQFSTVVDLAAGTGKLTRLLVPAAVRVVAVEPVIAMRTELARVVERARVVAGTAEAIPLSGASVDAVTVAQAFHWFNAEVALPEMHRVLRPGGRLGLVWNRADTSVPWVARLDSLRSPKTNSSVVASLSNGDVAGLLRMARRRAKAVRRTLMGKPEPTTTDKEPWWVGRCRDGFASSTLFMPLQSRVFRHTEEMDSDRLVDWVASFSRFSKLTSAQQKSVVAGVRSLASELPTPFEFPYRTDVFWTTKR